MLFSNLFLCNYPLVIDIGIWSFKFEVGGKFAGLHTRKRRNKSFLEKHHHSLLNSMKATLIKRFFFFFQNFLFEKVARVKKINIGIFFEAT